MNILITGASKGIGRELILEFSKDENNKILAISRDEQKLLELQSLCQQRNGYNNVQVHAADINKHSELNTAIIKVLNGFGELDLLINNAAQLEQKLFSDSKVDDYLSAFHTNFFSIINLIHTSLNYFSKKNGHIVNIGSMGGFQGSKKFKGLSAYSASKAALANLTECLAEEFLDRNIKVNCLALGSVETEMFQQAFPNFQAQNTASDMAKFIVDFCMYGSEFFNGKIIPVSKSTP